MPKTAKISIEGPESGHSNATTGQSMDTMDIPGADKSQQVDHRGMLDLKELENVNSIV
jgi:hypothetical protein